MRGLFTAAIILIGILDISAQSNEKTFFVGDVISDTTTFKESNYRKALNPILKSKYKIEIRLINSSSYDYTNYTILTFDEKWSAKHYYYEQKSDSLLTLDIDSSINFDSIFSKLVANNIFSLPDQDDLRLKKYSFEPETNKMFVSEMGVSHGYNYYLEFKFGELYRRYRYYSPISYAEHFPLITDLQKFVNIVDIYDQLTKE